MILRNGIAQLSEGVLHALVGQTFILLYQRGRTRDIRMQVNGKLTSTTSRRRIALSYTIIDCAFRLKLSILIRIKHYPLLQQ